MKSVFLVAVVAAGNARAQGAGSEPLLLLVVGPPALVSVALDITLLSTLVSDGTASRSRSISAMVFATLGVLFASVCLGVGLDSKTATLTWTSISAVALGIEAGSLVLGLYGLIRGEPEPEPAPEPLRIRRAPPKETPPQLFTLPLSL